MKKSKQDITFKFERIVTEQFAVIEEVYDPNKTVRFNYKISFGVEPDNRLLGSFFEIKFMNDGDTFLLVNLACYFGLKDDVWELLRTGNKGQYKLPLELLRIFANINLNTIRGVLHAKTENTAFNKFIVPSVNFDERITEDLMVEP
jgi:hypothetical protein